MARYELFPFQQEAAAEVHQAITDLSKLRRDGAVILSAPTGAGKTVIAASVIERLYYGDDLHTGDKSWTILWLSDLPQINEQTRRRLATALGSRLVRMEALSDESASAQLEPGVIYFLNVQKLRDGALLTRRGDGREHTIWEVIGNTIRERGQRFAVVIDEAHRGATTKRVSEEATSLMQRFVLGYSDMPPVPIVVGITATPARFRELIGRTARATFPVDVDWSHVIASGLLKTTLVLGHSNESQAADMTLARKAGERLAEMTTAWADYAAREQIRAPSPALIVQVADARKGSVGSATDIGGAIDEIRQGYAAGGRNPEAELPALAFAHSFESGQALRTSGGDVRYIEASKIEQDPYARIVFFKTNLSTGWDCPRAEAMMSFRTAKDETSITQLIGRLVRSPLARRVEGDERLNAVHLFLPHYDPDAVKSLQARLGDRTTESATPLETVEATSYVELGRNTALPVDAIVRAVSALHTERLRRVSREPALIRVLKIAGLMTDRSIDDKALPTVREEFADQIARRIKRLDKTDAFKRAVAENSVIDVRTVEIDYGTPLESTERDISKVPASDRNLATLYDAARRRIDGDVAKRVTELLDPSGADPRTARLKVFTFADLTGETAAIEAAAEKRIDDLLASIDVLSLREADRKRINALRGGARDRTSYPLVLPELITPPKSKAVSATDHLYVTSESLGKALNPWETAVLEVERKRKGYVGFLRNVDRQEWALGIIYDTPSGPGVFYPDLLVFRKAARGKIVVDILDPHTPSLADAPSKARALARYAGEPFALGIGRIEVIHVDGKVPVRLDAKKPAIRALLSGVSDRASLENVFTTSAKRD